MAAIISDRISLIEESELRATSRLDDFTTQQLGNWWLDSRMTAVLKVPSSVVTGEYNFMLNPAHPDFPLIQVEPAAIFHFDERLFK